MALRPKYNGIELYYHFSERIIDEKDIEIKTTSNVRIKKTVRSYFFL